MKEILETAKNIERNAIEMALYYLLINQSTLVINADDQRIVLQDIRSQGLDVKTPGYSVSELTDKILSAKIDP